MIGRLRTIAEAEQLTLQDDTLNKLVDLSDGDMRRSITLLQSAQKLRGMKNPLRPEDVMEVAGVRIHKLAIFFFLSFKSRTD